MKFLGMRLNFIDQLVPKKKNTKKKGIYGQGLAYGST